MYKVRRIVFVLVFFLFSSFYTLFALDIYVDAASSGGDGTIGSPYSSLPDAQQRVRNLIPGMSENIVVNLSGNFYLEKPLVFNSDDGTTGTYTITYQNLSSPPARILGGKPITGWESYSGNVNVFRANVGSGPFTALYENDRAAEQRDNRVDLIKPGTFALAGNYVYYYPRSTPIGNQEILLPQITNLITLEGNSSDPPLENLHFQGLTFSATAFDSIKTGNPGEEEALFTLRNVSKISITNCRILNAGNTALLLDKIAQNITIKNNRIDDFGGNGISLSGLVAGDEGYDVATIADVNRDNTISNNMITNGGLRQQGSAGVQLYQSGRNTVISNNISKIDGSGIVLSGLTSPAMTYDNKLQDNRIFRLTADSSLSAGIYAGATGNDNLLVENLIYQLRNYTPGNRLAGIFLDSDSAEVEVRGNAVYKVIDTEETAAGLIIGGRNLIIENNIFADNEPFHDILFLNEGDGGSGLNLNNNIFYTPDGWFYHYFSSAGKPDSFDTTQNLIYHPGGEAYVYMPPGGKLDYGQWRTTYTEDQDSLFAEDPLFMEPRAGLYRLQPGSPADWFLDLDFRTPGLPTDFAYRFATDRTEAEKYDADASSGGIQNLNALVQTTGNNNSLVFPGMYFSNEAKFINIRYALNGTAGIESDLILTLRLDTGTGPITDPIRLKGTGFSGEFAMLSSAVNVPAGIHDLIFEFSGSSLLVVKLDWFECSLTGQLEPLLPNQPPSLKILSPADGTKVDAGGAVNIEAWANDPDGELVSIELLVKSDSDSDPESEDISYTNTLSYTLDNLATGNYTLTVIATDNLGKETTISRGVTAGNPPNKTPVVDILEPEDGQLIPGAVNLTIPISATISESSSPIDRVVFYQNSKPIFTDVNAPYKCTWQGVQAGKYTIEVQAFNTNGDSGSSTVTITVDNSQHILGHWPLDDYGGAQTEDISGHNYHGDVNGAYGVDGVNGGAFDFPGNASIVTGVPIMSGLPQFTMAGWIYPRKFGSRVGLWGQDNVLEFGFIGEGIIHLYTSGGGSIVHRYHFPLRQWHHVAVMGDGKSLKLYLDGSLRASEARTTSNYGSNTSTSFNIGGGGIFDGAGNYFDGLIDDVIVYRKAISDDEVAYLARRDGKFLPSIRITIPPDGSRLEGPANVDISVTTGDLDSDIRLVEYFANDAFIGSTSRWPYNYQWTGVPPGVYKLLARITDDADLTTSDMITFTVELRDEDLLAYWSFDEMSDSEAYDLSPNQNHGTITKGVPVQGIYNGALRFEGEGWVNCAGLLNNLPAFTIAGWIKPEGSNRRAGLWGQDGVVEFGFNDAQTLQLWVGNVGSNSENYPHPINEWHHLAALGDGRSTRIYIDGKQASAVMKQTYTYGSNSWDFNLAGGGIFDSSSNYFTGVIDEVYVYRRALSAKEIQTLANAEDYLLPEVHFTTLNDGETLTFPFSRMVTAEVQRTEDCTAKAVEFFINEQSVYLAETPPYQFQWNIEEEPEVSNYRLKARLTTECGIWDEATINITIQPGTASGEDEAPGDDTAAEDGDLEQNPETDYDQEYDSYNDDVLNLFEDPQEDGSPAHREALSFDFSGSSQSRNNLFGKNYSPNSPGNSTSRTAGAGTVLRSTTGSQGNTKRNPVSPTTVYTVTTGRNGNQPGFSTTYNSGNPSRPSAANNDKVKLQETEGSSNGRIATASSDNSNDSEGGNGGLSGGTKTEKPVNNNPDDGNALSWLLPILVLLSGALALVVIWLNRRKHSAQR